MSFLLIKWSVPPHDIKIQKPTINKRSSKYKKQALIEAKKEKFTSTVAGFNTLLSIIYF